MQIPIAIHKDALSDFGVNVPDFPGVFSWGESIEHAIANSTDAIKEHVELLGSKDIEFALRVSRIEDLQNLDEYHGAIWALMEMDSLFSKSSGQSTYPDALK